jgi:hypothetical protein
MTGRTRHGEVRVRSNVVRADDENDERVFAELWKLVPGDLVKHYKPALVTPRGGNPRQLAENGYYLPCSECGRLAHQIDRDGCTHPRCQRRPDPTVVAAVRARYEETLRLIEHERERLRATTVETEHDDDEAPLDPESAVERFLGIAAVTDAHAHGAIEGDREPAGQTGSGDAIPELAKQALVERAGRTDRFVAGYCATPIDNLVDTITLGQARAAFADLRAADGGELTAREAGQPPKFCAAYSSAALAINSFAVWREDPRSLVLPNHAGFHQLAFETKFPTGLRGKPPNLDVVARDADTAFAIESKCLEYLNARPARFQPSYADAVEELADETWSALFRDLQRDPLLLSHLDVGQLLRHYLGLRRAVLDAELRSATLLYVFWEPDDAEHHPPFAPHRRDIIRLAERVGDETVSFDAISYPELWRLWEQTDGPPWLGTHVAALRGRYAVTLA